MRTGYFFLFLFFFIFSCSEKDPSAYLPHEKENDWRQPQQIPLKRSPESVAAQPQEVDIDTVQYRVAGKPEVKARKLKTLPWKLFFEQAVPEIVNAQVPERILVSSKYVLAGVPARTKAGNSISCKGMKQNIITMGIEEGLPSSQISAMHKDPSGRLWLGTDNGLVLYDGSRFYTYTVREGLCGNIIYDLAKGKDGRLWIATNTGLCVFDGQGFLNFGKLLCNTITSLLADSKGRIWIGTCSGLSLFDGKGFSYYTSANGLPNDWIRCLAEDYKGHIWIGTNRGFTIYDGKSFNRYPSVTGLNENQILCFKEDSKDNMWIGMGSDKADKNGEVWVFNGKDGFANPGPGERLKLNNVYCIQEVAPGKMWVGGQGEISMISETGITKLNRSDGIGSSSVFKIEPGERNQVLIGTQMDGLQIINYDGFEHHYLTHELFLSSSFIEDKQGRVWAGTYKTGIHILDSSEILSYAAPQGLISNNVSCMANDDHGNIWIGTDQGITVFDGKGFYDFSKTKDPVKGIHARIFFLHKDRKGNIWIGTTKNGIKVFDGKKFLHFNLESGLSSESITAITEDPRGRIWIGTKENGISMYDGKKITHYTTKEGLIDNYVLSIFADKKGIVWVGGRMGLSRFDQERFMNFSIEQGLCDNAVLSIMQDSSSGIWVGTGQGISCIREEMNGSFSVVNYRQAQGLCRVDCNQQSNFIDSRNTLWWGMGGMITSYAPEMNVSASLPPNVSLTQVDLMGRPVSWITPAVNRTGADTVWTPLADTFYLHPEVYQDTGWMHKADIFYSGISGFYNLPENLELPHDQNHLTFHFSGFTLSGTGDIQYRYILEGLEDKWSIVSESNEADYRNIPPGSYRFKVHAKMRNSTWSKGEEFSFRVLSPWWKSGWAYTGYAAAAMLLTLVIIRFRTLKLQRDKKSLAQTVQERSAKIVKQTEEIIRQKEQIRLKRNLHDTLGGVIAALRLNFQILDPEKKNGKDAAKTEAFENSKRLLDEAYAGIKDLSMDELLEDRLNKDFVNNISDLLVKAKTNFGFETRLQSSITEQQVSPEIKVNLYMILKEAITNCVTHSGGKQIIVRMVAENGSLHVLVVDDGKGFASKNGTKNGNGLKNMKSRVAEMNGTFSVLSEEGEGTALRIEIPIQKKDE